MYDTYVIKPGDNFKKIADKFYIKEQDLKSINNIYFDNNLRVGMEIIVPKNKETYFNYYTIEKGDSLYKIAEKYNINPTLLAKLNGLDMQDYIYPNQEILIPKSGYSYYITADGDTIGTVSKLFNEKQEKLLAENETIYLLKDQILVSKR